MFVELIALLIIFWIPPAVVIIGSLLWDLKYWQSTDYDPDRFYNHLNWDFEESHRRNYRTFAKFIIFLVLVSILLGVFSPQIPLLAVLIMFAFWVAEALETIDHILRRKFPAILFSSRNLLILLVIGILMALIPAYAGAYIFGSQGVSLSTVSNFAVGEISVGGIGVVPSVYIYLIFSTLIALAYDLGTPLLSTFGVYLTSPISWIVKQYWLIRARRAMEFNPHLLIIAVSGSYGKTTAKNLLTHILQGHYRVLTTPLTETSERGVAKFIAQNLRLDTQVLIVDVNAYKQGDVAAVGRLIRPHIAMLTGIDENHVGLFGSIEQTMEAKSEILRELRNGGTAILNVDDELVARLAMRNNSKEILYSFNPSPSDLDTRENQLEVDHYIIHATSDGDQTRLRIDRNNSELVFTIPHGDIGETFAHSFTAAAIAAIEVGVQIDKVSEGMQNFNEYHPEITELEGDNGTRLLIANKSDNIKQFEYLLQQLESKPEGTRILATSGLMGLGNHKGKVYARMREAIVSAADVVISYDSRLIDLIKYGHIAAGESNELSTDSFVFVGHPDDMLYQIRGRMEQGDTIAIHGEIDLHIVQRLRSML